MKLLMALTIVIFSGLSNAYAARASKACPYLVDYVAASGEPDTLGGPGGRPRSKNIGNPETSMPHGYLYQRGYDGPDFSDQTNRGRDDVSEGYGPHFDEGTGGPRSLD